MYFLRCGMDDHEESNSEQISYLTHDYDMEEYILSQIENNEMPDEPKKSENDSGVEMKNINRSEATLNSTLHSQHSTLNEIFRENYVLHLHCNSR